MVTIPFVSRAQKKWAYANEMPWADRWATETKNLKKLPLHVKKKAKPKATKKRKKDANKKRK